MPTAKTRTPPSPPADPDAIFDDFDKLVEIAQKSFSEAAQAAVAENDRLGIPTHGSENGKLVVRQPPKPRALDKA